MLLKIYESHLSITLIHFDITALYEIENTATGVIIIVINHDLVELQSILGCSVFCYGLCSRIGNWKGAFVKKGALSSAIKTLKSLES